MPYKRHRREPIRRNDPLYRTQTRVDRRGGLVDPQEQHLARRDDERSPRGRR